MLSALFLAWGCLLADCKPSHVPRGCSLQLSTDSLDIPLLAPETPPHTLCTIPNWRVHHSFLGGVPQPSRWKGVSKTNALPCEHVWDLNPLPFCMCRRSNILGSEMLCDYVPPTAAEYMHLISIFPLPVPTPEEGRAVLAFALE